MPLSNLFSCPVLYQFLFLFLAVEFALWRPRQLLQDRLYAHTDERDISGTQEGFSVAIGYSSVGRAGWLVIGRLHVQIPAIDSWAELSCMSKWPWARYWSDNCSSAISEVTAMSWQLVQDCLPSPEDSWDWLQQQTPGPGIKWLQKMTWQCKLIEQVVIK